jgi:hypothetical protein
MKGSVMDAMSEAIECAEVMLYGVSEKYKEVGRAVQSTFAIIWS